MNRNRRREVEDEAFSHIVSFSSAPPPPGDVTDVHSAQTTVAALPDSYIVDLLRGKADPITARYKVLPESDATDVDDTGDTRAAPVAAPRAAPVAAPRAAPVAAPLAVPLAVATAAPPVTPRTPEPRAMLAPPVDEPAPRVPSVVPTARRRVAWARTLAMLVVWSALIAITLVIAVEAWRLGAHLGSHYGR